MLVSVIHIRMAGAKRNPSSLFEIVLLIRLILPKALRLVIGLIGERVKINIGRVRASGALRVYLPGVGESHGRSLRRDGHRRAEVDRITDIVVIGGCQPTLFQHVALGISQREAELESLHDCVIGLYGHAKLNASVYLHVATGANVRIIDGQVRAVELAGLLPLCVEHDLIRRVKRLPLPVDFKSPCHEHD